MKTNYLYRLYGRSKGRGKNNHLTNYANSIKLKILKFMLRIDNNLDMETRVY